MPQTPFAEEATQTAPPPPRPAEVPAEHPEPPTDDAEPSAAEGRAALEKADALIKRGLEVFNRGQPEQVVLFFFFPFCGLPGEVTGAGGSHVRRCETQMWTLRVELGTERRSFYQCKRATAKELKSSTASQPEQSCSDLFLFVLGSVSGYEP